MVVRSYGSKCIVAFVGAVYLCSLLEGVISSSVNEAPPIISSNVLYGPAKSINSSLFNKTDQLNYRRHRRKLPNESNDQQFNSLDDNGLQFQEYQGVFGRPGVDFPVLSHIPITKFNCRDVKHSNTGYYADLDTHCQVFHVCDSGRKVSFLCPNGTIFRQSHLICDWWFRVECERSPELYEQSVHMLEADQHVYKQRAAAITNAMHNLLEKGMKESTVVESPVSVTNVFNSESELPKSTSMQEGRTTNFPPYNPPRHGINQLQNDNNFGPNTIPTPKRGTFEYQFVPVTLGQSATKQTEPSGRNLGNFHEPANANLLQISQKAQTNNPNVFNNGMNFDFKTNNAMIFTQPTSNTIPVRPTNLINSTPLPFRSQTSNWIPQGNYNSISPPPPNNFNPDQKINKAAKHNTAYHSKSQPINVPNFTPGKYPLTEQKYLTTRFSATPPRFTVPSTFPPPLQTSNDFESVTTNTPPRTSFTKSFFNVANGQFPVTTPPKTNKPTTKLQFQSGVSSLTSLSSPATTSENNYFREQQILAETASFTGYGKYPKWQNYYLSQNYNSQINQNNKQTTSFSTSPTPVIETTTLPEVSTTFSIYNMLINSQFANNSNQSYALYFPSDDNVIDLLNLVTPEPDEGVTDFVRNFSKPAVSELLLNSFATYAKLNETTPTQSIKETFPVLLRNETKEAYDHLFSNKGHESATNKDLLLQDSNGIVQSSSPKTLSTAESFNEKLKLKSTPDFRELAQIFSRALSAYLEDPEQFRKILSEVRPTEPPSLRTSAKYEAGEDEVLAFSEDERITHKPTTFSSTSIPTLRNPETFAEEINNFMFDPLALHTDSSEFNVNETYYPSTASTSSISFSVSPITDVTRNHTQSFTVGTTSPNFSVLPSPNKASLYDDKSNKFVDNSAQNLQDEPLLITADTQSIFASDNLVRYPLHGKYASKFTLLPPNLKSPAYPQFGVRTSSASYTATPHISSRADVATTPRTTQTASNIVTAYESPLTTFEEESLRTTINVLSPDTLRPIFNESAVNAMVDMMQEAKTNPTLRNKLVLLLVNNGQTPENRSVKDLKLKLLKALLVPLSTEGYDNGNTEQPISRRKVRKEGRVPTAKRTIASTTPLYRIPTDFTSKSTDRVTTRINRTGRATANPAKQKESDGLTDTDSRAVDLLKILYSLASNNWNR